MPRATIAAYHAERADRRSGGIGWLDIDLDDDRDIPAAHLFGDRHLLHTTQEWAVQLDLDGPVVSLRLAELRKDQPAISNIEGELCWIWQAEAQMAVPGAEPGICCGLSEERLIGAVEIAQGGLQCVAGHLAQKRMLCLERGQGIDLVDQADGSGGAVDPLCFRGLPSLTSRRKCLVIDEAATSGDLTEHRLLRLGWKDPIPKRLLTHRTRLDLGDPSWLRGALVIRGPVEHGSNQSDDVNMIGRFLERERKKVKKRYRRRRHSVSALHAHLVFCTKYRRRVFTPQVFDLLKRIVLSAAKDIGVDIQAIEADWDHVHLMLCYPPHLSLSKIVQRFKGATSRAIRKARFTEVTSKLWGNHFWSPSYFVVSAGGAPLDTVKRYIQTQNSPDAWSASKKTRKVGATCDPNTDRLQIQPKNSSMKRKTTNQPPP